MNNFGMLFYRKAFMIVGCCVHRANEEIMYDTRQRAAAEKSG